MEQSISALKEISGFRNRLLLPFRQMLARRQVQRSKTWFVDVPRTSSSSLRSELSGALGHVHGKQDQLGSITSRLTLTPHLTALSAQKILGEGLWQQCFTFSMVRNPWDRLVSLYQYRIRRGWQDELGSFEAMVMALERFKQTGSDPGGLFAFHGFHLSAAEFLCDAENRILVDYVARFEQRAEDLRYIRERLGLESLGSRYFEAHHRRRDDYRRWYTDTTAAIVNRIYGLDARLFGYSFEGRMAERGSGTSVSGS